MISSIKISAFTIVLLLICWMVTAKNVPQWDPSLNPTEEEIRDGFYCSYGEFQEKPLFWQAMWVPMEDDTPGVALDSGRTNPWEPVNSLSLVTGEAYKWVGWNSGCTKYSVYRDIEKQEVVCDSIGTWGEQIEAKGPGAYVPTWRDGAEGAYALFFDGFGAMLLPDSPNLMEASTYSWFRCALAARVYVMDDKEYEAARELVNKGFEVVNYAMNYTASTGDWNEYDHGSYIDSFSWQLPPEICNLKVDTTLDECSTLVVKRWSLKHDKNSIWLPDTLWEECTAYVSKDYVQDPNPDTEVGIWRNIGSIKANTIGYAYNNGVPKSVFRIKGTDAWTVDGMYVNVQSTKRILDSLIYQHVDVWNKSAHPEGFLTQYFVYPFESFSTEMHSYLYDNGYIGARGGGRRGVPTLGDFYDPFRVNYDVYNGFASGWSSGDEYFDPDDKYMKVGLNKLVENTVKAKGYMQRSVTTSCDHTSLCNCCNHVCVFGSVEKHAFQWHMKYLDSLRTNHKLYIAPPSEIAKYRLMTNAATEPHLSKLNDGLGWYSMDLPMGDVSERYRDEISVIVTLEEPMDSCESRYEDDQKVAPRYQPRKMDEKGYSWSISFNPFEGRVLFGPPIKAGVKSGLLGKNMQVFVQHMSANKISLLLPKGDFTAELLSPLGKVIHEKSITSQGGRSILPISGLGRGICFLRIKSKKQVLLLQKLLIQ